MHTRTTIVTLLAGVSALALPAGASAQTTQVGTATATTAAETTPQTSPADADAAAPLSSDVAAEIVVTAQRRAESVQRVPVAITAVCDNELQRLNITSPHQLTLIDPSVRYKQST